MESSNALQLRSRDIDLNRLHQRTAKDYSGSVSRFCTRVPRVEGLKCWLQDSQLRNLQEAIRAGTDNRLSLDSVEIQSWILARAQLDALSRAQKTFGELQDAVQRPLNPTEGFVITPESPALRPPAKQQGQR